MSNLKFPVLELHMDTVKLFTRLLELGGEESSLFVFLDRDVIDYEILGRYKNLTPEAKKFIKDHGFRVHKFGKKLVRSYK